MKITILALLASVALIGCRQEPEARVYRAPKEAVPARPGDVGPAQGENPHGPGGSIPLGGTTQPAAGGQASPHGPGGSIPLPRETGGAAAQPGEQQPISWTLPKGWKSLPVPEGGMVRRFATLGVDEKDPSLAVAVMPLPPQELYSNINRWRGQVGLAPAEKAELDQQLQRVNVGGAEGYVVDLTGPQQANAARPRMLATLVNRGGTTWSFKLMGPAEKIEPHKAEFMEFIKSIQFAGK